MQSAGRRESRKESNVTMRIPFTGSGEECKSSVSHNIVEGEAIGSIPGPRVLRRRWQEEDGGSLLPCCPAVPPEEWGDQPKRNAAVQFGGKG